MPRANKIEHAFIVTIDGPAGAGKSTVSRLLAEALDGLLLDTGGMYRGLALIASKQDMTSVEELQKTAISMKFDVDSHSKALLINGEDLGFQLRTQKISDLASQFSRHRPVRKALTSKQRVLARKWAKKIPVVVEGRDIGTVVFPAAPFKFFVTAAPEVRARRRLVQLKKQGAKGLKFAEILKQNEARDLQDSQRKVAPLKCPADAVVVDTSAMRISQVVKFMREHIHGKLSVPGVNLKGVVPRRH